MPKNEKNESVILPIWLQRLFMAALFISVSVSIVFAILVYRVFVWANYTPLFAPIVVSLVIFFMVLDKKKSLSHNLFITMLFYQIIDLLSMLVVYGCGLFSMINWTINDAGTTGLLIYGSPAIIFTSICLFFVYYYRKQIRAV